WSRFADRYPFYSYFDPAFETRLSKVVFEHLDAHCEPRLQTAGDLYMRTLSESRIRGEFYTPDAVVDYCLAQTRGARASRPLLDPACGTGNFLLGALARSDDKLAQVRSLYGYDIDGRAVAIARVLLLIGCSAELRVNAKRLGQDAFASQ